MKNALLGIYGSDFFHGDTFNGLIIYSFGYSAKMVLYFYSKCSLAGVNRNIESGQKCCSFWCSI